MPKFKQTETTQIISSLQLAQTDKNEDFRIHAEVDIVFILREIMQKKALITFYFDGGNRFILTAILAIDIDNKEIIMDYGIDKKLNQLALKTSQLIFVTSQNRIKIEFVCDKIRKIQYEGRDAFAVNIPASLVRMQRRNHFRISTPITKPMKCIIPLPPGHDTSTAEVTLLDISCGGIAVIDHHPIISFDPDNIYKNCQIRLTEIGTIHATIQVKNTYEMILRNGLACKRAGCEFIALPVNMQAMIQRYIVKQEQLRRMS